MGAVEFWKRDPLEPKVLGLLVIEVPWFTLWLGWSPKGSCSGRMLFRWFGRSEVERWRWSV